MWKGGIGYESDNKVGCSGRKADDEAFNKP